MPELTLISWRDIPALVSATDGSAVVRHELPQRFQNAIDAAAMKAGLVDSDAYLEQWRKDRRPCGPDLEAEVESEVERLDTAFDRATLLALTRSGGVRSS